VRAHGLAPWMRVDKPSRGPKAMTKTYAFYERSMGNSPPLPLSIKSLMTIHPKVLAPDDLVLDAMNLMRDLHIRHLPIVAKDTGRLEGLVTEMDILRTVLHGRSMTDEENYHATLDVMLPLSSVMVRDVITLDTSVPIADVVELFLKKQIRCVPVVDANRTLQGIVTETDLMKLLGHMIL